MTDLLGAVRKQGMRDFVRHRETDPPGGTIRVELYSNPVCAYGYGLSIVHVRRGAEIEAEKVRELQRVERRA